MSTPDHFYITTPIYYVNDVPHIGHAYTTVAADVLARYWRLRGRDVFFLTGLDEHGQKVQQAAAKAGIDPQAHCDKLAPQFQDLWKRLNISNDAFIRTTDAPHKSVVQRYLQDLFDKQLIYKADYTGWYCTFDERFWTEKDVESGLCPDCKRPVERISEHNYFFKMGQYQEQLIEHIKSHPDFIRPESRRNEVLGFLTTQKLGDLSISRPKSRLSWGIALPFDQDYVTYVWFDALVNYVSGLEYLPPTPSQDRYWPASVHLVGKDILTTHAVYWSTMLMALNLPLPETIFAHGWWTVDGEKMSKSRGNVVDPNKMIDAFGADAFRYFLFKEVPFGQDGDFSQSAMVTNINSDLANGIGNLLSRTLTMIERFAHGTIPTAGTPAISELEAKIATTATGLPERIDQGYRALAFRENLQAIWELIGLCDEYIDKAAPWKLAKNPEDQPRIDTVLNTTARALRLLSVLMYPYMPHTAGQLAQQLGLSFDFSKPIPHMAYQWETPLAEVNICKGPGLFPRIESKPQGVKPVSDVTTPQQPTAATPTPTTSAQPSPTPIASSPAPQAPAPVQITIDDFMKIQLKTAKVLSAERVPKSEKLLKLQVSLGEGAEQRQIVAGIGKKYEPEALIGKMIIIVANLKPAKLMGIESQGMVLAAGDSEVRGLATILEEVDPGTKVK
ncbi:MAG: methionine--tRNA ligase [Nitrospirota bacterium]|nr:methionine--tRNA ligase [Nitrospirota bacterium]MDP2382682.1 methionine--tRNA ligase [Nitrospirota bacterium]